MSQRGVPGRDLVKSDSQLIRRPFQISAWEVGGQATSAHRSHPAEFLNQIVSSEIKFSAFKSKHSAGLDRASNAALEEYWMHGFHPRSPPPPPHRILARFDSESFARQLPGHCHRRANTRTRVLHTWTHDPTLDLISECIYDKCSVGPSIRPICTRCCFAMTNMIRVCSNFH